MRVRLPVRALLPLLYVCAASAQTPDPSVAAADAAYDAKRYTEAIPLYRQVVASQLPDDVRARAQSRIGYAYHADGNKVQARLEWERTANQFTTQPRYAGDALLRAGNLAAAAGDIGAAATLYQRAVDGFSTLPDFADTIVQAASHLGYMRLKQFERSKVGIEDPTGLLAMRANYDIAIAAFRKVTDVFPQKTEWVCDAEMNVLELMQQGVLYGYSGSYADVIAGCDVFLKDCPSDKRRTSIVMLIRAEALHQDGFHEEAIGAVEALRQAWPLASAEVMGTSQRLLATCYADMGDFERAITEYSTFLNGNMTSFIPNSDRPRAQYQIGRCLRLLGQEEEAVAALTKVKKVYPSSGYVINAEYELQQIGRESVK